MGGAGLDEAAGGIGIHGRSDGGHKAAESGAVSALQGLDEVVGGVLRCTGGERGARPVIGGLHELGQDRLTLGRRGGGAGGGVTLLGLAAEGGALECGEGLGAGGAVIFLREPPGDFLHVRVGTGLDRAHERGEVGAIELRHGERLGLLMLHFPDAGEIVVAVGANRGVGRTVLRPAGVVVNDRLVVEIDDVECAVGADAGFDRAEPEVRAAHELGFLAARFARGVVAHTGRLHELVVDDVERGLAGEVAVVPLRGPGAAFVDRAAGGGGEATDLVDLHISLFGPLQCRERALIRDHALPRGRAGQLRLREHTLGQHRVEEHRAAGRLRPEDLAVPRRLEAPGVAVAAAVLFERGAVGLEAHDAAAASTEFLRAVAGGDVAAAVAVGGVDPAVEAPAQIVDHGVRVANTEARVELRALVGDVVAVGVLEEPDIGGGGGDHAAFVEDETRDELEPVGEDVSLVHDAVAVGVGEDRDAVLRLALHLERIERTAFLPHVGVGLAAAVGIFGRLADPEAAPLVPVEVHDLVDQRLGGDEGEFELGVELDLGGGFRWMGRATFGVAQRVTGFVAAAEDVDVGALAGPGDAAEQERAVVGAVEIFVAVAGQRHEGAIRFGCAGDGALVGPHLRLDVVNVHALALRDGFRGAGLRLLVAAAAGVVGFRRVGGGEDVDVFAQVHVVVDLVVHGPIRRAARDRVAAVGEVDVHRRLEPLGRALAPRAANDGLVPFGIAGDGGGVKDDDSAAAFEKCLEVRAVGGVGNVAAFLGMDDQNVGVGQLRRGGKGVPAGGAGAAFIEQRHPFLQEARVVVLAGAVGFRAGADEDAQRGVGGGRDGCERDEEREEEAFHGRRGFAHGTHGPHGRN